MDGRGRKRHPSMPQTRSSRDHLQFNVKFSQRRQHKGISDLFEEDDTCKFSSWSGGEWLLLWPCANLRANYRTKRTHQHTAHLMSKQYWPTLQYKHQGRGLSKLYRPTRTSTEMTIWRARSVSILPINCPEISCWSSDGLLFPLRTLEFVSENFTFPEIQVCIFKCFSSKQRICMEWFW